MADVVLNEVPVQHVAAKVVFAGEKITLPIGMEVPVAITTLQQFMEAQEANINVAELFPVFPWDGAYALKRCLEKRFGFVNFQGAEKRQEIGPGLVETIPWGVFQIANLASFRCGAEMQDNRWCFKITATCRRKSEMVIRTVFKDVRDYLAKGGSIYQGKAIKLRLEYDDGQPLEMPEPSFVDVDKIDTSMVIFNQDIEEQLEVSLYTPIRRVKDLRANGISVKRAVMLAGTFGTGKTMGASMAAKIAVAHGVTFLYIKRASELAAAIDFAKQYAVPACMIFVEDIDRGDAGGQRDVKMDDLLNIIDGLESKNSNIMIVLTTNDKDSIHPAMLRPGRLDSIIEVTAPNAMTAERILRKYVGDAMPWNEDISAAAALLDGQTPAVISECVKRAKLAQLSLQPEGTKIEKITGEALRLSALSMSGQIRLLAEKIAAEKPKVVPELTKALHSVVTEAMNNGGGKAVYDVFQRGGR